MNENNILKTWTMENNIVPRGVFSGRSAHASVSPNRIMLRYEKHYNDPLVWHSDLMALCKVDAALFDMEELSLFQKLGKKFSLIVITDGGWNSSRVLVHPYTPEHPEFEDYAKGGSLTWVLKEAVGGRLDIQNFPEDLSNGEKGFDIISVNPKIFGALGSSLMAVAEKPTTIDMYVTHSDSQTAWWRMVRKPGSNIVTFTCGYDQTVQETYEVVVSKYWLKEQPKLAQSEE